MNLRNVLVSLSIASLGASMGVSQLAGAKPVPFAQGQEEDKPKVDYSKKGNEVVMVPFGIDLLQETTMPLDLVNFDTSVGGAVISDNRVAKGIRQFATPVEPGQTLKLTLKATPMVNYMINWILPSDKSDPLYSKIKLNIENQLLRKNSGVTNPTISIKNTSKERCLVFFAVYGMAEQPYSVKIERK